MILQFTSRSASPPPLHGSSLRSPLLFLLVSLSLTLAPLHAQQPRPDLASVAPMLPTINAAAIRAHTDFLSNDLLEGRATGSRGYELAAAYVAAQFRQYGLLPFSSKDPDSRNYLQSVPLIEATVVLPGSVASLRRDGSTTSFEFSKDYLPSANFFNSNSAITAPLVFAGYGIEAPELNYNDFTDLELQGRIAIIFSGAPERFNAQARDYYAWRDSKYATLVKHGALGVIEVDPLEHKDKDSRNNDSVSQWDRAVAMSWVSDMRRVTADEQPDERFPELKLRFRFRLDAAAQLFTSNGYSLDMALQKARMGEAQGFVLPGAMTLSATTGLRRIDSNNVLGMIRGSDARLRNEYILVTANLDHLGRGASINGDSIYNGQQRNAVGMAMLLDMARSLSALPSNMAAPKRSIIFAAVTAGEKGGRGLEHLLLSGPIATRNIVAGIALDMPLPIARTSDVLATGADQSSIGTTLASAAQQQNLRLLHADEPLFSLLNNTLAPLARADIPSLSLHSGLRARSARTDVRTLRRDWMSMHINQPSDDAQNTPLDTTAARDLAQLNAATVLQLANAESRPVWYRDSLIHRKLTAN